MSEHRRRRSSDLSAVVEGVIALAVVGLPLVVGGALPGAFVATGFVGALALALVAVARGRDGLPWPPAALALAGGTALALLSLVPWPAALTSLLSPRAVVLASLPPEAVASFVPTSLDPALTLVDAARLGGLLGLCLASIALVRREGAAVRLGYVLLAGATLVAVVTFFHTLADASSLFGLYPIEGDFFLRGPFVNPNHAASVGVLGACAAVGLWRDASELRARLVAVVGGLSCAGLALASGSVGGAASLVIGLSLAWPWSARSPSRRGGGSPWPVIALIAASLVTLLVVMLAPSQVEEASHAGAHKWFPWPATLDMIRAYALTGVGRGVFGLAFEAWAPQGTPTLATYPENLLLHWSAEWGVPAALVGVVLLVRSLWRSARVSLSGDLGAVPSALLAGVVATLIHDLADFGLELAGVAVPFAVALGVVLGRAPGRFRAGLPVGLATAGTLLAVSVAALSWGLPHLADHELARLETSTNSTTSELEARFREIRARHPSDPFVHLRAAETLLERARRAESNDGRREALVAALPFTARVLELSTRESAHLVAARALQMAGRRPQAFSELRAAFVVNARGTAPLEEALRWNASAEEVGSMIDAYISAKSEGRTFVEQTPTDLLAGTLDHLRAERGRLGLAWLVARETLATPRPSLELTPRLLRAACSAAADDGHCRTDPRCTRAPDGVAHGRFLVDLAARAPEDPLEDVADLCLAEGKVLQGDVEGAMESLRAAVTKKPSAVVSRIRLAELLLQAGRAEAAAMAVERAPQPVDTNVARRLLDVRVRALVAADRSERAAAELQRAVGTFGHLAWPHLAQARFYAASGRREEAVQALDRAESLAENAEREAIRAERARLDSTPQPAPERDPSGATVPRP